MRLLLDTHSLLWSFSGVKKLSGKARLAIQDFENQVHVSAASAWEIATKFRLGKLPEAAPFVHSFGENIRRIGFQELVVSIDHAQRAGLLAGVHRDPFDRFLIAQAQAENLLLVSNETLFDQYGVQRLW